MITICKVYNSYAQAREAVKALESSGVASSDVSLVANKYVSREHASPSPCAPLRGTATIVSACCSTEDVMTSLVVTI